MRQGDPLKRLVDVSLAALLLVLSAPLQILLAVAVRLDSPGPALYRAVRVGRDSHPFTLYKFRTMIVHAAETGPAITGTSDPRITLCGGFLRRTRLDELPQLWNVLRGDMSLVGPRPEDPRFVALYTLEQRRVLTVRPGLTGPAQLTFRREAEQLGSIDPESVYIHVVLPRKLAIDLQYVDDHSLLLDLRLLWATLLVFLGGLIAINTSGAVQALLKFRRTLIILSHLGLVVLANYVAFAIRFDGAIPADNIQLLWAGLPLLVSLRLVSFQIFRLYEGLWRYTGLWDLRNLLLAVGLSTTVFALVTTWIVPIAGYPRSIYATDALLAVSLLGGMRLIGRLYREASGDPDARRVLILGAGDSGALVVHEMKNRAAYNAMPVGFVDDDRTKKGLFIHGVRVLGTRRDLPQIVDRTRPDEILVALPHVAPTVLRDVLASLEAFSVPVKLLPVWSDWLGGRQQALAAVRPVAIDDLLTRPPVHLDAQTVHEFVHGQRVLVTGAGGSIGSELCRQIAACSAAKLVMLDRYENGLYAVERELLATPGRTSVLAVIGDVTDRARMRTIFREHRPDIIFHAAAHKHVPLMEGNPCEAVKNNVLGTRTVVETAVAHGAHRLVLISTDKAVNPSSVMGATKRVAELVVQSAGRSGAITCAVVRFGNVLGSHGSVVPLFADQIKAGGPVTVTHPEVRRFFMLIPEAVELVLHASSLANGEDTFILEMGEQVPVLELARNLIRLAGFRPGKDIDIVFTGLRPGEKMAEELVGLDEVSQSSGRPGIQRVRRTVPLPESATLLRHVEDLCEAALRGDEARAIALLATLVRGFRQPGQAFGEGASDRTSARLSSAS